MKNSKIKTLDQNSLNKEYEEDVNIPHYKFHWDPKQLQSEMPYLSERFSINFETEAKRTAMIELRDAVTKILAPGKSILNCDESMKLGDKLVRQGLHNNKENRGRLRNLLFDSQTLSEDSLATYISLVILDHEALFQKNSDGDHFRDKLRNQGILFAIQVDKGTAPMFSGSKSNRETIIQGLDDLDKRCLAYRKAGCDAAKFTAVFKLANEQPSQRAIEDNVRALARFASVCQAYCLVPIIGCELSVSIDSDVDKIQRALELILVELMVALAEQEVSLEATILAPSMCAPGRHSVTNASTTIMACASVSTIRRTVPPAVAGIAFLTTAQELEEGCVNLDAISNVKICKPWPITLISGEALLSSVISVWNGQDSAADKAQNELMKWAMITSLAIRGVFINAEEESHLETTAQAPVQDNIPVSKT
ncbi:hypothetical protein LSTR_LSTR000521 [Laodelphax striatellus]|uniref:fructose-bisphosphate aldolase n=1 Tax=Laodelphax striatellus TaxID=195883 RepID=A0A482WZ79_LAOST|nr:hypothetical protein LSTR_LSTR000521 [Laodelphax striatellus]